MRTVLVFLLAFTPSAADVLSNVAAHSDRFGAVSRQIWENPELGFHETKSSPLAAAGAAHQRICTSQAGVAGMPTAFTASFGSGKPVIVLMGEFDALPGLSQKDIRHADRRSSPALRGTAADTICWGRLRRWPPWLSKKRCRRAG